MKFLQISVFSFCALFIALAIGCAEPDQIERYTAKKPHILQAENHVARKTSDNVPASDAPASAAPIGKPTDRMLAALVLHQDKVWSFKVTGPMPVVKTIAQSFPAFLQSVKFVEGKPTWKLPAGWQTSTGSAMRFATIKIDAGGGKSLDFSIMPLPAPKNDYQGYVLANVNRWRGQMGLPKLRADQLKSGTAEITIGGIQATYVNLKGISSGGMRRPFASGGPLSTPRQATPRQATPQKTTPPRAAQPKTTTSPIRYDVPQGWKKSPSVQFSKVSFIVTDNGKMVVITASDLAAFAGGLLTNVNRWRGQVRLEPVTQAELKKQLKLFPIDSVEGHYVELFSPADIKPRKAILGMIAIHGKKAWFFKLTGDAELATREKERFETFVRSIRFN